MRLTLACLVVLAALALVAPAQATLYSVGDSGPAVAALNDHLAALSYLPPSWDSSSYSRSTYYAVIAFQKQAGLSRDGIVGPETRGALKTAKRPRPRYSQAGKRVEINLTKQVVYVIRDGRVKRTIAVSTGKPGYSTPVGSYRVYAQYLRSWSYKYQVWLPYASYFNQGIAIHAYYSVPVYPASHGCVRVPEPAAFAPYLYRFLDVGSPVRVYY